MTVSAFEKLVCPLCGAPFDVTEKSLFCRGEKRHCFDIASSGYVHLNAPGKARNARTGDDREMIRARSAFLALGHFDILTKTAADLIDRYTEQPHSFLFADAGCGEGTHTRLLAERLAARWDVPVTGLGFDASKAGTAAAAREAARHPSRLVSLGFCAANLFSLPLPGGCLDLVTSFFAPIAGKENRRILKNGGFLLVAASGKRHLWELRQLVYDHPTEASGEVRPPEGFIKETEETVSRSFELNSSYEIENLFRMTPFSYKTSPEDTRKIRECDHLRVTAEFRLELYRKDL